MDNQFMIDQMQLMHTLCKNQLEQTTQLVQSTVEFINGLLKIENIQGKTCVEQIIYFEEILNKFQSCHNLIRNINIQFIQHREAQTKPYLSYDHNDNGLERETQTKPYLSYNHNDKGLELCSKLILKNDDQYMHKKFNLNNIIEGENISICITCIPNKNQFQFYGSKKTNDLLKLLELVYRLNIQKQLLSKYKYLPKEDEIFGVDIDETLFRAVIDIKTISDDFSKYTIILIDFGDELPVSTNINLYHLPKDILVYPAQAFKCEIKLLENQNKDEMLNFLEDLIYTWHTFKVVSIKNETVYLQTSTEDISYKKITNSTNPFLNIDFKNVKPNSKNNDVENFILATRVPEANVIKAIGEVSKSDKKSFDLTLEDKELLFAEEFSTGNPLKAVMGFNLKDDSKICKFSKKGSCFKKSNCRFLHLDKLDEGWSRDEKTVLMNIKNEILYPQVGSFLELIVTHVETPECIYVQLNHYFDMYFEMLSKLNCNENIKNLEKYSVNSLPLTHDLVLSQYQDGNWYRARIDEIVGAYYSVFFVDYGNTEFVLINRIRKWKKEFEKCPFMAVKCRINGIRTNVSTSEKAVSFLKKELVNQKHVVEIVNNIEDLCVNFKIEEKTLSQMLIDQGLVLADLNPTYGTTAVKKINNFSK